MILPKIKNSVCFLSAEFAIDNDLPTYSGGLGVLAADLLNVSATQHYPMVGIGILYKGKEFIQHITQEGREEKRDTEFDHDSSFLRPTTNKGKPVILSIPTPSGDVKVKAYHLRLSDTTIIFFLSTDIDGNPPGWISDMDSLYHGDSNSQIRQQILLGIGGIKLLQQLEIEPSIYHINEGRPEFIVWELIKNLKAKENISYDEAFNKIKDKIVYTNHTLVSAGNLIHPISSVNWWAQPIAMELGEDVGKITGPGVINNNEFSITKFALQISKKQSSVSRVHGEYCKKSYPDFNWVAITNGVHMDRWQDSDYRNPAISDTDIWNLHMAKKRELMETVVKRTGFGYDPEKLVITWARRLAEYKQPKAIFQNIEKLHKILTDPQKPVQLLFAGNSHSADPHAKSIIEEIIKIFSTDLAGSAIFIPNYNIALANHLTSGSDLWLNTPKGNLEACGTSGMKAIANGVLNCTVLDGWTYEIDWADTGWTLDPENIAENFYSLLDNEISPLYFKRNESNLPVEWIQRMRKSIEIAKGFSAERMLEDFKEKLYK